MAPINLLENIRSVNERLQRQDKAIAAILQRLDMPALETFGEIKAPVVAPSAALPVAAPIKKEPYQYRPLDAKKNEIRLLSLAGCNNPNDPVRLELLHISLDWTMTGGTMKSEEGRASQSYKALSYCWGAPLFDGKAVLHGHEFPITKSLEAGLKRLRYGDGEKLTANVRDLTVVKQYFWVDQLCKVPKDLLYDITNKRGINQSDIEERNSQITLMRRIYKKARQVIVWLGVEADDSETAVQVLSEIGRYVKLGPGEKAVEYPELSDQQKQKNWNAVRAFYQRDWWQRSWIRQEIALTRLPNMLCGKSSILYTTVIDAVRYMGFLSAVPDERNSSAAGLPFGYHANQLAKLANLVSNGDKFASLSEVLMVSRGSKATDPRDMVYAVLGMADPERHSLVPDYRSPMREIYIEATKAALPADRHLQLLGACQNPNRLNGLPSWVPNLTENWTSFPFEGNHTFRGIAWNQPTMQFVGEELHVRGFHSDKIEFVSDMVNADDDGPQLDAICAKWKGAVSEASQTKKLSSRDKDINTDLLGGRPERAWIEFLSIMADGANELVYDAQGQVANDAEPAKLVDSPNVRLAHAHVGLETEQIPRSKRKLRAAMRKNCVGRRLFTSKAGTVGLAPGDARAGDSIAILHGAQFPYILRKSDGKNYVIVGDAWLPVYTRGSAASSNSKMICIV
jgi:hypothetical protein